MQDFKYFTNIFIKKSLACVRRGTAVGFGKTIVKTCKLKNQKSNVARSIPNDQGYEFTKN